MIGERVLRPALVAVAKGEPKASMEAPPGSANLDPVRLRRFYVKNIKGRYWVKSEGQDADAVSGLPTLVARAVRGVSDFVFLQCTLCHGVFHGDMDLAN